MKHNMTHKILFLILGLSLTAFNLTGCSDKSFSFAAADLSLKPEIIEMPEEGAEEEEVNEEFPPIETEKITDNFEQKAGTNKLDILIVIDNSDSMFMDFDKKVVLYRMQGFLQSLAGLDYQIAFTTTDSDEENKPGFGGQIETIITPSTPNKEAIFNQALDRQDVINCRLHMGPHCGSNEEQPLKVAMKAVNKRNGVNAGFFRNDSELVVLVISDEDENDITIGSTVTPENALAHMQSALGASEKIRFYGVIIQPGDSACFTTQKNQEIFTAGAQYGVAMAEAARLTGGITTSICSPSWVEALNDVAAKTTQGSSETTFTLSETPIITSLVVYMNPMAGFRYKIVGRKLTFEAPPSQGTKIQVRYDKL